MPGLIENTLAPNNTATGTKVYGAETNDLTPSLRSVDPAKETVAGQLNSILSSGSPYLESARAGARETANSRGLLNSSMAAGAGESEAIKAALPIASADASVYGTASRDNQSFENNANQFNAGAKNQSNQALATAANTSAITGQQAQEAQALQATKGAQATSLANIEANYKQLIQTSASAADLYKTVNSAIAAIMADTNTTQAQKQAGVDKMTQMLESGLSVIGPIANVDLKALLDFS